MMTKLFLKSWDLSADDDKGNSLIDITKPFYFHLNLEIEYEGVRGSHCYVLGLSNLDYMSQHDMPFLNHVLLLDRPFYPKDIVEKIEAFLTNLEPISYDAAVQVLRNLFRWEFESNLQFEFRNLFLQN